jgi:hypothetical protein
MWRILPSSGSAFEGRDAGTRRLTCLLITFRTIVTCSWAARFKERKPAGSLGDEPWLVQEFAQLLKLVIDLAPGGGYFVVNG